MLWLWHLTCESPRSVTRQLPPIRRTARVVDFDEAMARGTMYRPFEAKAREKACNLFKTQEGM